MLLSDPEILPSLCVTDGHQGAVPDAGTVPELCSQTPCAGPPAGVCAAGLGAECARGLRSGPPTFQPLLWPT